MIPQIDRREAMAQRGFAMGRANRTHGASATPEYGVWESMLQRCENPNDARYHRYGGRGITVCARWHTFPCFLADMGPRPSDEHSIDRMDNDGNYEPANCQWATRRAQALNRPSRLRDPATGRYLPKQAMSL